MTRRMRATCPKCLSRPEGTKHCHGECDEVKPLDEFHNDKSQPDGKTGQCKSCNNESSNAYQAQRLIDDPNFAEQERMRKAEYWVLNGHRFNYNRNSEEYRREYNKMWREMPGHAASVQAYSQVRRARKVAAEVNEPVNREHLATMYDWMCMVEVCHHPDGRAIDPNLTYIDPATGRPDPWYLTTDHIIQIGEGGDNSYANTRPAHLRCNLSRPRVPHTRRKRVDLRNPACNNDNHDKGTEPCG